MSHLDLMLETLAERRKARVERRRLARLKRIVDPVRRCPFCKRENDIPDEEYAQNPFCSKCLHQRIVR